MDVNRADYTTSCCSRTTQPSGRNGHGAAIGLTCACVYTCTREGRLRAFHPSCPDIILTSVYLDWLGCAVNTDASGTIDKMVATLRR